jgi:hypothetical protein
MHGRIHCDKPLNKYNSLEPMRLRTQPIHHAQPYNACKCPVRTNQQIHANATGMHDLTMHASALFEHYLVAPLGVEH